MQPWEDIQEDATLMDRLETWLGTRQHMQAKIHEAAAHFGVEPERIQQAARESWCLALVNSLVDGAQYVCVDSD